MSGPTVQLDKQRISSIDLLRGIVMVIMALDHVRDFYHIGFWQFDPTDLSQTSPALFFTRWITHFCAPVFVFLSGVSGRLGSLRKSRQELARFLLTRGLWLIVLEVTVIRLAIFGSLYYDATMFQVIYAIGGCMVVLSLMLYLHASARTILYSGIALIFLHNLLEFAAIDADSKFYPFSLFIYQFGFYNITPHHSYLVNYPLVPWLGIFLTGFGVGHWFYPDAIPETRQRMLLLVGLGGIALFVVLRAMNLYGDPSPWSPQRNFFFSVMSFINCTKYPVSLLYTLMTLGPAVILLGVLEKYRGRLLQPVIVFGRVPLFYYILHFSIIHISAIAVHLLVTGQSFSSLDFHFSLTDSFGGLPKNSGYALPWVYVAWMSLILLLFPVCKAYENYKRTHKQWWLSYL